MSAYAFGLITPRDFLEKARREIRRLERVSAQASSTAQAVELQDLAINAAWTIWHVSDWIARSPESKYADAIERIRLERPSLKTAPLQIVQEHILDNSHMALCEALANGAKHFVLRDSPSLNSSSLFTQGSASSRGSSATVTLDADVTVKSDITVYAGVAIAPQYVAKLRINGVALPALDAFKGALAYWDKFFETYKL